MTTVAVIVPVLGRPQRAKPLALSLQESQAASKLTLTFVCSRDDDEQIDACNDAVAVMGQQEEPRVTAQVIEAPWPPIRGDYARKIHLGLWSTTAPYVFTGADDLEFEPGWADHAVRVMEREQVGVVGTNDDANPTVKAGRHATHVLVDREYAVECGTIDTPGLIFHEQYFHLYCDNELVETAKHRDCWAFAPDAVIRHRHPIWRTAESDATYERGNSMLDDDRALFRQRRALWRGQ